MSTSQVPTIDRENSAAHLGTRDKHQLLGSQRKWGEHQPRSTPVAKQFGGNSTNLQKSHRSFGEISNTLVRGSEGNRSEVYKEAPSQPSMSSLPSEEPEFIPHIQEKKDYSDVFPSSLSMSHNQMVYFTHFWRACQKPDLHTYDPSQISISPPRNLSFLPRVKNEEKVILEPVPEDLLHLPPPWE